MGLLERIDEFEKELYDIIEKNELDKAAQIVFDNIDEAVALTRKVIPEKAEHPLRIKFDCNWPCGSGSYNGDEDYRVKKLIRERVFGWETELLTAQNERRVNRLMDEARPRLEKRYGMKFEFREELAILNRLFDRRKELVEKVKELRDNYSRILLLEEIAEKHPGVGWEEIPGMWREYRFRHDVISAADDLVCLVKDVQRPEKLILSTTWQNKETGSRTNVIPRPGEEDEWDEEEEERDNLTYNLYGGHSSIMHDFKDRMGFHDAFWPATLDSFSASILAGKNGNLDFRRALNLANFGYAERAGMSIEKDEDWTFRRVGVNYDNPPEVLMELVNETLKKSYENRRPRDECSRFMDWMAKRFLKRWKTTAVDHERWFSYHRPNKGDQQLMLFFYHIRDGKEPNEYKDERPVLGRLPAVLRLLVEDKIIDAEDIQPPLKETYLLPNQLLNSRQKLLTDGGPKLENLFEFKPKQKPKTIATTVDPRRLLPDYSSKNLPVKRDDLTSLALALNPDKEYYVLYKGNHTLFLAADDKFPSGAQSYNDIRRLTLIPEGTEPELEPESSIAEIRGQRFLVKPIRSRGLRERLRESMWSTHADLIPAKCYTFVVDCSPDEFAHKYMKDMLAHVQFFGPGHGMDDQRHLAKIDELLEQKATEIDLTLGWTGGIHFRTFEVTDKFAFQIRCTDEWRYEETVWIAYTVKSYVEDVGLGIHTEVDLDEHGRVEVKRKIADRVFFRENIEWVKEQLKGPRLLELILRISQHKEYDCSRVGKSYEPCEHCGQDYMSGWYYLKRKEQDFQGVSLAELHALSCHPETYVDKWGRLRKIVRTIKHANDISEPVRPLVFQYPELVPEFEAFANAYNEELRTDSEGFGFWMENCGGYSGIEEEELEDNPELRKLREKEEEINRKEWKARADCEEALQALQEKYDSIEAEGKIEVPENEHGWEQKHFWSEQLFYLQMYRMCNNKLLTDRQHSATLRNLPINFHKG